MLLDNCVPWRLSKHILGHHVDSVVKLGWADLNDGSLLEAMLDKFDALVTVDKSLRYQQRMNNRSFGVILLRSKSNKLGDLVPLVPALLAGLRVLKPGEVRDVGEND